MLRNVNNTTSGTKRKKHASEILDETAISTPEDENKHLKAIISSLKEIHAKEKAELSASFVAVKTELSSTVETLETFKQAKSDHETALQIQLSTLVETLEKTKTAHETALEKANLQDQTAQLGKTRFDAKIAALTTTIRELEVTNCSLREEKTIQVTALTADRDALKKENAAAKQQCQTLQQEKQGLNTTITALTSKISELESQVWFLNPTLPGSMDIDAFFGRSTKLTAPEHTVQNQFSPSFSPQLFSATGSGAATNGFSFFSLDDIAEQKQHPASGSNLSRSSSRQAGSSTP